MQPVTLARRPRHVAARLTTTVLADVAVILLASFVALVGRSAWPDTDSQLADRAFLITPILVVSWVVLLACFGAYQPRALSVGVEEYQRVLVGSGAACGGLATYLYLSHAILSRAYFVLVLVVGTIGLLVVRRVLRAVAVRRILAGHGRRRALIVGTPTHASDIVTVLRREVWLGIDPVGALSTPSNSGWLPGQDLPILGEVPDLQLALARHDFDTVVFAEGAFASGADMRRTAWLLEKAAVEMVVVPSLSGISAQRLAVHPVAGLPLMFVDRPRAERASRFAKRVFDVVGSLGALVVLGIPLLVAMVAIKSDDGGPILFRQRRIGRDGKPFECLKLRTMVVDAEERLEEVRDLNEGMTELYKSSVDPRVTRVGRRLRRWSVDEVPQLFNVLRGEMSLIGPRPALPHEVEAYAEDVTRRLAVKPGMTGLWQVSGRSELSWDDTVRLDLYYVDNWSMMQDLQILMRTVRAVVRGQGAY